MTDGGALWALGGIVVLVLAAAYLSAIETVLSRLPLVRALRLREEDADGSVPLLWLLEHRATSLNVVLLLTVTVRIISAALATWYALHVVGGPIGVAVAAATLVVVSMVLAEVAPRTLTLRHLEDTSLSLAGSFRTLVRLLDPAARAFVATGRSLVRVRSDVSGPFAADDEVRDLAAEDTDEEIDHDERAMIHSIFELGDTVVREIMVPRPDMIAIEEDAPLRDLVNTIVEHGHSRIPVYRDSKDDIVGVVFAKDVLRRLAHQPGREAWDDLVRDATFVPETKQIDDLLRFLQESAVHQAMVVDEYGALTGLVTIEDILEEIVGEIVDEHDREEPLVEVLDDVRMRVDARLPVDDLNELLSTDLPDEGWDTVGGLVVGTLGRVPEPGEHVDIDGLTLVAERVQGRRVAKVLVTRREDPDRTDDERGTEHVKPRTDRQGPAYDEADLLRRARAAKTRAYAPYSGFHVGCAVLVEDGRIFEGVNVENAAYGLTGCAEQTAIRTMASTGYRGAIVAVAVVGDGDDPVTPCGACRQVIFEFGPDATVYSSGDGGRPLVTHIRELLPHAFGPRRLSQGQAD